MECLTLYEDDLIRIFAEWHKGGDLLITSRPVDTNNNRDIEEVWITKEEAFPLLQWLKERLGDE